MRILLLTPPMTQLNTPYPATAYLTGFLRARGYETHQADPALALVLRLFSRDGLTRVAELARARLSSGSKSGGKKRSKPAELSEPSVAVRHFLDNLPDYLRTVEPVVRFLQGGDPTLAMRIAGGDFLPEGPRMQAALAQFAPGDGAYGDGHADALAWAFGALGVQDRAKHLATLYLDDLADVIHDGVDEHFTLSRYGEKLAASVPTFDPLAAALTAAPTLVDELLREITVELFQQHKPTVVGLTVPFPGNVYGGLRIAETLRQLDPSIQIIMGGGYVNTELRSLSDPRIFDYVDFITLDDGERPLLCLLDHLEGKRGQVQLLRTYVREQGRVVLKSSPMEHDIPLRDTGTPTYDGLPVDRYLSLLEMLNPMHRVWSDGRWNKITLAHGCYWKACNFCDTSLDYIGVYEEQSAELIADRMVSLIEETGQSGFHFVDEAAPPKTLLALSERLLARDITCTWWGNVRFEKTFAQPQVAAKLRAAGCVAVSGGLEVASDRLLKLMNKGVTVEQVARVTHALAQSGILVHAYLMYGFPTQTVAETVDALERVRQLFAAGCLTSAFWHRFSVTAHSPIGRDPEKFGINLLPMPHVTFAHNDLDFHDPTGVDHDALGIALRKAVYNFMHGVGLDEDVRFWFDFSVPKASVPRNLVRRALAPKRSQRV
ncbi:MAG: radical SAM protein [Deltaproteobacteria bacterium]|nr:radical SAM protein [Deltaproteobacteria bacterium]